ncbi:MAG TPA: YIP1 family protein [Vicinamibacterales bacterium]|nr:YIP1 family protein [Vicinamibacterales bacterium]
MTVIERVAGVLRLQPRAFEDIEADVHANGQALGIVVLSTLAAGVGGGFYGGPGGMVAEALGAVVGWVMWAAVTYVLGARLLPERDTRTDMGELLRVMGYSSAPTFFSVFAALPLLGRAVPSIVSFWLLATTVLAVRQALDYRSTMRAFAVVIIGWLLFVAIRDIGMPWLLRY